MGLSLAALRAGQIPKKSPVANDTLNDITTELSVTGALNVPVTVNTIGKILPSTTPINPPSKLSTTASIMNWSKMSRDWAPTARRKPISLVRSVTLTNMIFMIPIPPTNNEIPAIAAKNVVSKVVMVESDDKNDA